MELQYDVEEFDEEGLYLLNNPISVGLPYVERNVQGNLKRYSRIRVFDQGNLADVCNVDLCNPRLQNLIRAKKFKSCAELSTAELNESACMAGEYFIVQVVENTDAANCFCTESQNIDKNITRISRVETRAAALPKDSDSADDVVKSVPLFDANSTQFVARDSSGKVVYEGYINAETVATVGSEKMKKDFAAFIEKYTKMKSGDYVFVPDYSKKAMGLVGVTVKRMTGSGDMEEVKLDFYTSRRNIPVANAGSNHDKGEESIPSTTHSTPKKEEDKKPDTAMPPSVPPAPATPPVPPAPAPAPAPVPVQTNGKTDLITSRPVDQKQSEEHKAFVRKFHSNMKALVYEVTHAESTVLREAVGSKFNASFDLESKDKAEKSSDEKGLCWRYVALGLHKTLGVGSPYLPSRPPVADKAKNSYDVLKGLTHKCPDGRVIPTFKKVAIPSEYRVTKAANGKEIGISRNALFVKQNNSKNLLQQFIDTQLLSGDVVVWDNPSSSRAGHIEAYFPESRSNGPDDAFFSDYRGDMDQKDGNPDRPGGRSTNTLKYILRYNSC